MSAASSRKSTGDGFMADAELALDDTSDFTIGSFIQTVYDQVPATITREQALGTLMALQETYDNPDIAKRLALLAEDCEIEDPAGLPRGGGKAGMEAFFRSTFDNGVRILRHPRERIIRSEAHTSELQSLI